jgi:cytochrome b involved in lipid metabolism
MSISPEHTKGIFVITLIIVGAMGLGFVFANLSSPDETPTTTQQEAQFSDPIAQDELPYYTLAEVAEHNSSASCWMAAYNNVYDITEYVAANMHPGGQGSLASGCGKEMTGVFDRIHSTRAKADLEMFKIGLLASE